jgi:hypothetical protein
LATSPKSIPLQLSLWTSSSSDHLARVFRSPESASGWTTRAATWPSSPFAWLQQSAPAGFFSRTCPASCRRTADGTLEPFSQAWSNAGMGGPTGRLTLSISEFPSAGAVCSLSDVLETGEVPQRYFLSAKACAGILRRAERRGIQVADRDAKQRRQAYAMGYARCVLAALPLRNRRLLNAEPTGQRGLRDPPRVTSFAQLRREIRPRRWRHRHCSYPPRYIFRFLVLRREAEHLAVEDPRGDVLGCRLG